MNINILFPVFNEENRLYNGIEKTLNYLDKKNGINYQLTIIDNASTDRTPQIAKHICDCYKQVKYVRIEEKGVGIAFREGIERNAADIVGYMDIDLSTNLKHLYEMMEFFETDKTVQYVNGSRFNKNSITKGRKILRKVLSKGLLLLLKTQLHMKSTDALCGFTFLRKEIAENLVKICNNKDNSWFYTVEMLIRAEKNNINIVEIPVEWQEDYNSTVNIINTVKVYLKRIYELKKELKKESVKKN